MILEFLCLFSASCALAYLIVFLMIKRKEHRPQEGSKVRIRAKSAMLRSRFVGVSATGWLFSPPLNRDQNYNLIVGEPVTVEGGDAEGGFMFRTNVLANDNELVLEKPAHVMRLNRREGKRWVPRVPECKLEGFKSEILDISRCGARLFSTYKAQAGERVQLEMSTASAPVYAWVLAAGEDGVRVRFEE